MIPPDYAEKLRRSQQQSDSWLCVGLDPRIDMMPRGYNGAEGVLRFCSTIIEATQAYASVYKPNLAFFLAYGGDGISALEQVIKQVPSHIPVLLDAKVGDIGTTQVAYGHAAFVKLGVDAMTVSPYVGADAVLPLLEGYGGVGLYLLARTSNPGAQAFQDHGDNMPLFRHVVERASEWGSDHPDSTLGVVVGATYPQELASIRAQAPDTPFLIPGVGTQGGSLEAAVQYGATTSGLGPVINVSRGIIYASQGDDFAEAAANAAKSYRDQINEYRRAG